MIILINQGLNCKSNIYGIVFILGKVNYDVIKDIYDVSMDLWKIKIYKLKFW
jgi:hypothetical protein